MARFSQLLLAVAAVAALAPLAASALQLESADNSLLASSLRASIQNKLSADASVAGIENCLNKCQLLFNTTAYSISQQAGGGDTYEYTACAAGCSICEWQLSTKSKGVNRQTCYTMCKDTDWLAGVPGSGDVVVPVNKGIVEADKACMFGCVINTCQSVCSGGTLGMTENQKWWPNGGCTIKTGSVRPDGYYSQNAKYSWWNTPGGQGGQNDCCSNAISLCNYNGDTSSTNYKNVYAQAYNYCKGPASLGKKNKQGPNTTKICDLLASGVCGQEQIN